MNSLSDNTNINFTSFNEEFCTHLEFHLTKAFGNSDQPELKRLWCDGISWHPSPESQLSKNAVQHSKRIITKAWIGTDGQEEYLMTIEFGHESLSRYANDKSMLDCFYSEQSAEWIEIDPSKKTITLKLK